MMDLIIPVYKNIPGLYRTLMSIGTEVSDDIKVTIVDDCSGDDYTEIIRLFQKLFPIRVFRLDCNCGPGVARQFGLNEVKEEYVSFIDCGDTFVTPTILKEALNIVRDNPEINMFCWEHLEEYPDGNAKVIGVNHNRMHGKIYKRDFLVKHEIEFNPAGSRANEDIGFNILCRFVNRHLSEQDDKNYILHINEPMVVWKSSGPSIVRANNCAYYYKEQNIGYAINLEHAVEHALKLGVSKEIISDNLYNGMACMYLFYLSTVTARPEFTDDALAGALYYYKNVFSKYAIVDAGKMKDAFYDILVEFLSDKNDPVRQRLNTFDYAGFLNYLQGLVNMENEGE